MGPATAFGASSCRWPGPRSQQDFGLHDCKGDRSHTVAERDGKRRGGPGSRRMGFTIGMAGPCGRIGHLGFRSFLATDLVDWYSTNFARASDYAIDDFFACCVVRRETFVTDNLNCVVDFDFQAPIAWREFDDLEAGTFAERF